MSTLHTVNKSPFEKSAFDSCLRFAGPGSAVLLIEDGVYAALKGSAIEPRLREAGERLMFYALGPDLKARGFGEDHLVEGVAVVDYAGFVDLAVQHDRVQAWL